MTGKINHLHLAILPIALLATPLTQASPTSRKQAFGNDTTLGCLSRVLSNSLEFAKTVKDRSRDPELVYIRDRDGNPVFEVGSEYRAALIGMIGDPDQRPLRILTAEAAQEDIAKRSRSLSEKIDARNGAQEIDEETQVYDHFVLGAGPQGSNVAQTLAYKFPDQKVLVVDSADKIASTFADIGAVIEVNSSTRKNIKGLSSREGGNQNPQVGPVQTPDLTGKNFNEARVFADVAAINLNNSQVPVLLEHETLSVKDSDRTGDKWPARYEIQLKGKDGRIKKIYSNIVINASGVGEVKRIAGSPEVLTYEEFAKLATTELKPMARYADRTVMVVGGALKQGDSARTTIEYMLRLMDDNAYGRSSAQTGSPKKIIWVGPEIADCLDYIANNRVRYARVAAGIKSGKIVIVPGKLMGEATQTQPGEKFRVTITPPRGKTVDFDPGQLTSLQDTAGSRATGIEAPPRTMTEVEAPDVIIGAIGYESKIDKIYEGISGPYFPGRDESRKPIPFNESTALETIPGTVGGKAASIGKRLANPKTIGKAPFPLQQDIYFTGPSAGKLIGKDDLLGVEANSVSLFNNTPRAIAIAEFAGQKAAQLRGEAPGFKRETKPEKAPLFSNLARPALEPARLIARQDTSAPTPRNPLLSVELLKAKIGSLFGGFDLTGGDSIGLQITRAPEGQFEFQTFGGIDPKASQQIYDSIQKDPKLVELVAGLIGKGNPQDGLILNFKVNKTNSGARLSFKFGEGESIFSFASVQRNEKAPRLQGTREARPSRLKAEANGIVTGKTEKALGEIEATYQSALAEARNKENPRSKQRKAAENAYISKRDSILKLVDDSPNLLAQEVALILRSIDGPSEQSISDVQMNLLGKAVPKIKDLQASDLIRLVSLIRSKIGRKDAVFNSLSLIGTPTAKDIEALTSLTPRASDKQSIVETLKPKLKSFSPQEETSLRKRILIDSLQEIETDYREELKLAEGLTTQSAKENNRLLARRNRDRTLLQLVDDLPPLNAEETQLAVKNIQANVSQALIQDFMEKLAAKKAEATTASVTAAVKKIESTFTSLKGREGDSMALENAIKTKERDISALVEEVPTLTIRDTYQILALNLNDSPAKLRIFLALAPKISNLKPVDLFDFLTLIKTAPITPAQLTQLARALPDARLELIAQLTAFLKKPAEKVEFSRNFTRNKDKPDPIGDELIRKQIISDTLKDIGDAYRVSLDPRNRDAAARRNASQVRDEKILELVNTFSTFTGSDILKIVGECEYTDPARLKIILTATPRVPNLQASDLIEILKSSYLRPSSREILQLAERITTITAPEFETLSQFLEAPGEKRALKEIFTR